MTDDEERIVRAARAYVAAWDKYSALDDVIGDVPGHPKVRTLENLRLASERESQRMIAAVRREQRGLGYV